MKSVVCSTKCTKQANKIGGGLVIAIGGKPFQYPQLSLNIKNFLNLPRKGKNNKICEKKKKTTILQQF